MDNFCKKIVLLFLTFILSTLVYNEPVSAQEASIATVSFESVSSAQTTLVIKTDAIEHGISGFDICVDFIQDEVDLVAQKPQDTLGQSAIFTQIKNTFTNNKACFTYVVILPAQNLPRTVRVPLSITQVSSASESTISLSKHEVTGNISNDSYVINPQYSKHTIIFSTNTQIPPLPTTTSQPSLWQKIIIFLQSLF